jgi:putative methionine-R-sulfoxide reductase with GAF domain
MMPNWNPSMRSSTELSVPVRLDGHVVGVLVSESTASGAYDASMVSVFASLAAIAAPAFARWRTSYGASA